MAANRVFREVDVNGETATLVNHPLRYDGEVPELHTLSTEIGSHTSEILHEMGLSGDEIERLFSSRVVSGPARVVCDAAE